MTIYSPDFNVTGYELRGEVNEFLSGQQLGEVNTTTSRVSNQLDWVAQLLGWSGREYWFSFNPTVDQKRQLLKGSHGVYNGYIYPTIEEVRNWDNSVVIQHNPYIKDGQVLFLNDLEYVVDTVAKEGDNLVLKFKNIPVRFYDDIANNFQLKTIAPEALSAPFRRADVGASGDRNFLCEVIEDRIILYPEYNTGKTIPYVYNTFYTGSRYYFSLPVKLIISEDYYIGPTYQFDSETWYIDIPCELTEMNTGLSARLDYEGSFLIVSIKNWSDPSDWIDKSKVDYFTGVWGDKGGPLPFHFTFDSLSLHGFDERKSIHLPSISRSIKFDFLLNAVYLQTVKIDSLPPPITHDAQLWWNSQTGKLSIHEKGVLNCGPWIEVKYPYTGDEDAVVDFVFPDVSSFHSYSGEFYDGCVVQIVNAAGLSSADNLYGLTQTLTSGAQAVFFQSKQSNWWIPMEFIYTNVADFAEDSLALPSNIKVTIQNSDTLSEIGSTYEVANLKMTISEEYPVLLMKYETNGKWYLSPPPELKYIGNTRLFESSLNYAEPVEGEMVWDYANPNLETRAASTFYYNNWEFNTVEDEWELKGNWVNVNDGSATSTPPSILDFGVILVYCDGKLLTDGVSHLTDDYQITYSINATSGEFEFSYYPKTYKGAIKHPAIEVSDSLTTSFRVDITKDVFSGLPYYMSPNVEDSETLLRTWRDDNLFCRDDLSASSALSYSNALIADLNTGPISSSWERYFFRLPPSYQRNGDEWQKVNLTCQDFAYWGSSALPEDMGCPSKDIRPSIYDELYLMRSLPSQSEYIYSEPYLYSTAMPEYGDPEDFGNAVLLPSFDDPNDTFTEAEVIEYDPLHDRRADVESPMGRGYGDWQGDYYRVAECYPLTGHLINDIVSEALEPISPPVWDYSVYKMPSTCVLDKESGMVDANHYKIGYAFFAADLSAAEEAVFSFSY